MADQDHGLDDVRELARGLRENENPGETREGVRDGFWDWRNDLWEETHRVGGPRKEALVTLGRRLDQALCTCDVARNQAAPNCRVHSSGASQPGARSEAADLVSSPRSDLLTDLAKTVNELHDEYDANEEAAHEAIDWVLQLLRSHTEEKG